MPLKAPTRKAMVSAEASPSASGSFAKPPATTSTKASPRMWKRMGINFAGSSDTIERVSKCGLKFVVYQLFFMLGNSSYSHSQRWWCCLFESFDHPAILEQSLAHSMPRMIDFVHQEALRWACVVGTHQPMCHCLGWQVKSMQKITSIYFGSWHSLTFEVFWRIKRLEPNWHQHNLQQVIRCQIELVWKKKGCHHEHRSILATTQRMESL